MNKVFFSILLLSCVLSLFAQITSTAVTPIKSFNIQKVVIPPNLSIVEGSAMFADKDGNMVINANENCAISFTIKNEGRGNAYGCVAKIVGEGATEGLTYSNIDLPTIKSGELYQLSIPIISTMYTINGQVKFTIQVDEPNGFGTDPLQMTINTHKFDAPFVEIVSYRIYGDNNEQKLLKKKVFRLEVLLQNTDQGVAHDVKCSFKLPDNLFLLDGTQFLQFAELQPNEQIKLEYELQSNANISDQLTIPFLVSESYGKYAKNADIPLNFGQTISSMTRIDIAGREKEQVNITKGSLISDVDTNIPKATKVNANTFAVIIANENYQQVASVPFALNDGNIFREYCKQTLGIPEQHIHYLANATGNNIRSDIHWLEDVIRVYEGKAKIIFYYAGHGLPDESNNTAYLMPIDGNINDLTTCYKLDDLYKALGNVPAQQVNVFIDACFSGSKRGDGMLASARGIAIKAKQGVPIGNMVVFAAAQGNETAYPYAEQQHGLFTYYLLKKLQETVGDITLQDLGDYIRQQVSKVSIIENNKSQTPTVSSSNTISTQWQTWKLK